MILLASGGHCILAIAEDIDKFYRLGETKDISPGVVFDKVRRLFVFITHYCPNFGCRVHEK